jgi:NIMA (never in mitosis gene a)-related kinase
MMDPKQRDKCLKEVKLMQPLDHPNIIKYLDSFIYNNELIIATEWAERGDLKRLIKNASQDDTPI